MVSAIFKGNILEYSYYQTVFIHNIYIFLNVMTNVIGESLKRYFT